MRTFANKTERDRIAARNHQSIRLDASFTPIIPSRRTAINDALRLVQEIAAREHRRPDSPQNHLTSCAP